MGQRERRALVVDDDDAIRTMVSKILEREHYHVDGARDGAEAIERLKTGGYDLILLDLMMPRVDGYSVLSHLRNERPDLLRNVIVMTALTPHEVEEPVSGVLQKPFDVSVLIHQARTGGGMSTSSPGNA
jgi:CheY-like chemotaxis protein